MKKIIIGIIILAAILTSVVVFYPRENNSQDDIIQHQIELDIQVTKPTREIYNPYSNVTIVSNNNIETKDTENTVLTKTGNKENNIFYTLRVNSIPNGESQRLITVIDEFDQEKYFTLNFTRDDIILPPGFDSIDPWEESELILFPTTRSLVDKENRLAEDYEPEKIVDLNKEFGIYTLNDARLETDTAFNLNRMWKDLGEETGDFVTVVSGYRSWLDQFRLYSAYVKQYGEEETNKFSARPGHSEHQLGTTVDFSNKEVDFQLTEDFGATDAGKWLEKNAYKYGFIGSYPIDAKDETGFYEPWQYRYVGIDTAKQIYDSEKTLYEFLKGNQ